MLDVVCIGSATIDIFFEIEDSFKNCKAGEKILVKDVERNTGGGGSNSAIGLSRFGLKVAYLGKFGNDENSKIIKKEFKKNKVKLINVKDSKKKTAFSVVMESKKEKDRIIYVYKGATNELRKEDFKFPKTKWIYLASVLDETLKTVKNILKGYDGKLLFNPSSYLCENKEKINSILKITDVLVLNKEEAKKLLKSEAKIENLAEKILEIGVKEVIITDGKKGVYYSNGIHKIKVPTKNIKVISTAGAGDAFTSGFLAGIIKKEDVLKSLRIGVKNAESVIQKRGAKNGLLSWNEIKK